MLLGADALKKFDIEVVTPAMRRRSPNHEAVPDHPGKQLDSAQRAPTAVRAAPAPTYDTEEAPDLSYPLLVESQAAPPIREPVVSRPMRAKLGLPASFFVPARDADFLKWDAMYPETTPASIEERLHHQCPDLEQQSLLCAELWTGRAALREYVGGCPPPAAFAPIRPPMRDDAAMIFVVQHTLSPAARAAVDQARDERLQWGIDEPTTAHSQMPVFTQAKPNTTERRVLFDDSANNSLNMVSVGLQLPKPQERALFLRDARIVSSIDMASFFTQLRLADDTADFWVYDGGDRGRIRTKRMVQGNSESPAIAQAFIEHILRPVPQLQGKLLLYIDNVYLKSTAGDVAAHIQDIGYLVRALAEANVTVNMRKSLWCATRDVEILGRTWSANGDWSTFDHRVETLRTLPMPTTVKQIQRLCGGINAISEHVEWSQALLAPFYEASGKKRLARADVEKLRQPWHDLLQALQKVELLFVPPPGAPLVLRTDASNSGVGAVLLAQRSEDANDLAPVAYFSKIFGGQQGRKHSTWREACAVYEAVKHFYPYLDGCVNLRIETDCGTVVSMFARQPETDADQIVQFRLGLTELGVKKGMIVHRAGVDQETADWLSRAKERLRPSKVRSAGPAEATIGADDVVYTVGYLSDASSRRSSASPAPSAASALIRHYSSASAADSATPSPPADQPAPEAEEQLAALGQAIRPDAPSEYWDCQHTDDEIQAWIELCRQRASADDPTTPDFRAVEKKQLVDGRLYHLASSSSDSDAVGTLVPVLTRAAMRQYVRQVHGELAHAGARRLLGFVKQRAWCPGLDNVVLSVCQQCHTCQITAIQTLNHTPLAMSELDRPREHIYVDFCHIGNRGEQAQDALVVVDAASGFLAAIPVVDETAATLSETLETEWFQQYGVPLKLTSDNGPAFRSAEFAQFLHQHNIRHIKTAPYNAKANVAESAVKKLKTSLQRCWADQPDQTGWSQYLPRIVAAYALTPSEMLGTTPAAAFFGSPALASDCQSAVYGPDHIPPTADELEQRLQDQIDSHRTMVRTRANARENRGVRTHWFLPGEWVTVRPRPIAPNLADLFTRRRGPYRVVARYNTSYALAYADQTPFPRTVPGADLMLYRFEEGADPAALSPTPADDVEVEAGSSWHPEPHPSTPGSSVAPPSAASLFIRSAAPTPGGLATPQAAAPPSTPGPVHDASSVEPAPLPVLPPARVAELRQFAEHREYSVDAPPSSFQNSPEPAPPAEPEPEHNDNHAIRGENSPERREGHPSERQRAAGVVSYFPEPEPRLARSESTTSGASESDSFSSERSETDYFESVASSDQVMGEAPAGDAPLREDEDQDRLNPRAPPRTRRTGDRTPSPHIMALDLAIPTRDNHPWIRRQRTHDHHFTQRRALEDVRQVMLPPDPLQGNTGPGALLRGRRAGPEPRGSAPTGPNLRLGREPYPLPSDAPLDRSRSPDHDPRSPS